MSNPLSTTNTSPLVGPLVKPVSTPSPPGPIAKKLLAAIKKSQVHKIPRLDPWRQTKIKLGELRSEITLIKREPEMADFQLYAYALNWVMGFVEAAGEMQELATVVARYAKEQDIYQPDGPPFSPIAKSYFCQWMNFDVRFNKAGETIASILLALGDVFKLAPSFYDNVSTMSASRIGLYVHEGNKDGCVVLRELVTGTEHTATPSSRYHGKPGELWLTRVLPPPKPATFAFDIIPQSPYIILQPKISEWQEYLRRTLPKMKMDNEIDAYEALMKHGLQDNYWIEYIFEAYSNYNTNAIFLYGLPDVAESRPHSKKS